jgi:hypothetical protein
MKCCEDKIAIITIRVSRLVTAPSFAEQGKQTLQMKDAFSASMPNAKLAENPRHPFPDKF